MRRGDVGHNMYIIKSGECYVSEILFYFLGKYKAMIIECANYNFVNSQVMSPDENEVLATLREGSVFGEISLMGIDGLRRRTATVR